MEEASHQLSFRNSECQLVFAVAALLRKCSRHTSRTQTRKKHYFMYTHRALQVWMEGAGKKKANMRSQSSYCIQVGHLLLSVFYRIEKSSLFFFLLYTPKKSLISPAAAAFLNTPGARCLGKRRRLQSRTARLASIVACPRAKADFPSLLHPPHWPQHQHHC